jgi:hypothetical protein
MMFILMKLADGYGLPEDLSLAYNNNYLTFQFVGITLQSPKKVKYQYKLAALTKTGVLCHQSQ